MSLKGKECTNERCEGMEAMVFVAHRTRERWEQWGTLGEYLSGGHSVKADTRVGGNWLGNTWLGSLGNLGNI
jgi:hypothetical protein